MMAQRESIIHGNEGLPVAVYDVTPAHGRYHMATHWHPEHEILFVRRGHFTLRLNQTVYELSAGDVAFYAGGTIHTGEPSDCDYTCILLNLPLMIKKSDMCMRFADDLQSGGVTVEPLLGRTNPRFAALCEQIRQSFCTRKAGYAFDMKAGIFAFFGEILNSGLYTVTAATASQTQKSTDRMKAILQHLEENYMTAIQLDELATLAHMTPAHLCRCFKAVTGRTPIAFLIDYRLDKARYSLMTTDRSITDIALACGFNDVSYFTRLFRQKYAITPNRCKQQSIEE